MKLWRRLQQLERQAVDAGCPACRDRHGRIVLRTTERLPDGSVGVVEEELQPCKRITINHFAPSNTQMASHMGRSLESIQKLAARTRTIFAHSRATL